jgi:hypothetical protein
MALTICMLDKQGYMHTRGRSHTHTHTHHKYIIFVALSRQLIYANAPQCYILRTLSACLLLRFANSCCNARWFKYDRDDLCVNKSQFVSVIFEPPCSFTVHVYNLRTLFEFVLFIKSLFTVTSQNVLHLNHVYACDDRLWHPFIVPGQMQKILQVSEMVL